MVLRYSLNMHSEVEQFSYLSMIERKACFEDKLGRTRKLKHFFDKHLGQALEMVPHHHHPDYCRIEYLYSFEDDFC